VPPMTRTCTQPIATARHVVVRVTPSIDPISSVTSRPTASSVGPSTTAMKSNGPVTASRLATVESLPWIAASSFLTAFVFPGAVRRDGAHLRQLRLRLRTLEPREIAPRVLGPVELAAAERAEQRQHRAELLQPQVDAALADASRPEAHDQDTPAVRVAGRVVDALGRDHFPIVSVSVDFLSLSHGSASSIFGVNQT